MAGRRAGHLPAGQVRHRAALRGHPAGRRAVPEAYLVDNATPYEGPFLNGDNDGKGLESIQCTDERNIVFHLKQPVGDFPYALALTTFAPVLPEKDTKLKYGNAPYSNGPYRIASRDDQKMVLVRNNFWTEQNDQVRKAYPDKIVFTFRPDDNGVVTNELIQDEGAARNTILLDSNVSSNFLQQVVNDPTLIGRSVTGQTGARPLLRDQHQGGHRISPAARR